MPASHSEIYLHFIWTTYARTPLIGQESEAGIYACIVSEARRVGCWVAAINGMTDHVHLVVQMTTRVSAAQLMQQVKGVSSTWARDHAPDGQIFRWQEGYGVFSISRSHLKRVVAYVENQKAHHANGKVWPEWETPVSPEPVAPPQLFVKRLGPTHPAFVGP